MVPVGLGNQEVIGTHARAVMRVSARSILSLLRNLAVKERRRRVETRGDRKLRGKSACL